MVFLHPLPHDRSAWLYQVAHFATWFSTIAIDLPGLGDSPRARDGVTFSDLAAQCWDAVGDADEVILVGCSIGSRVAQFMAAERPARVRALVLTGGWSPPDDERFRTSITARIARYTAEGIAARRAHIEANYGPLFAGSDLAEHFTELWIERNARADAAGIVVLLRALLTPVPDDLHARIGAPTLVISGADDRGRASHALLAQRIAHAELRVIEGAGHICNLERPAAYDAAVVDFLRSLSLLAE